MNALRRKAPWLRLISDDEEQTEQPEDQQAYINRILTTPQPVIPLGGISTPPVSSEPSFSPPPVPVRRLMSNPAMPIEAGPASEASPFVRPVAPLNALPEINPLGFDPATSPTVIYNNKGRPTGVEGSGDPLTRNRALATAQEGYKPGFSKKDFLLQALTGFLRGGLPGVAANTIQYGVDPNYRKQVSMGGEMERTQGAITQGEEAQRQGLNDRLLRRKVIDAETPDAPKVTYGWIPNPTDPEGPDVYGPLTTGLVRPKAKKPETEKTFNTSPGQRVLRIGKDGKPELVYEHPDRPKAEKPDDSAFTNEQVQESIREAQAEREGIRRALFVDKSIPKTTTITYSDGSTEQKPNPEYEDQMKRYRALDDDVRNWRQKIKPGRPSSPTGGVSEQAIRAAAEAKGLDPEKAVERARQRRLL